jgi:hypothetical protein
MTGERGSTDLEFHELELAVLAEVRLIITVSLKSKGAVTILDTILELVDLFLRLLDEDCPRINETMECSLKGNKPRVSMARWGVPSCCNIYEGTLVRRRVQSTDLLRIQDPPTL